MCITLWCNVNGRCVSRLEPAAEGTICAYENNTNSDVTIPKKVNQFNNCNNTETNNGNSSCDQ